ncbi:MAG: xanthine dehydrogenase family protein molybdopterin-binding subunit [Gemmatimonadetes bacterium]|nr:xanthine dehydrogenase family protein molybdopterin-binding subunit [Gemmatimonadota bacterium]
MSEQMQQGQEPQPPQDQPKRSRLRKWTRRAFIGAGAAAGGGLVLGVGGVLLAPNRLKYLPPGATPGDGQLGTWIKISPDNLTTVLIPHCEMGQGALTGLGMLLAEELDADWNLVEIQQAPAEDVYANGYIINAFLGEVGFTPPGWLQLPLDFTAFKMADIFGIMTTGGSTSTRGTGAFGMRLAGASARAMLLEAGAEQFGVPVEELGARGSRVTHAGSGRSATYGELAALASTLDLPRRPTLKSREEFVLVGTPRQRADIPSKVVGAAQYGMDVVVPDMLYAAITKAPIPGGQLTSVDQAPARAVAGVREVVLLPDAVAVVADGYWQASQGLAALSPQFTDAGVGGVDSEQIHARHTAAIDAEPIEATLEGARAVTAEYRVPYLHHATMEPMAATARLAEGRLDVWAGTQDPLSTRRVAAEAAELDVEQVTIYNQQLGGGFGRRLPGTYDYVEQAVHVAKAISPRAVKLIWSREEDMQHGYYRPCVHSRFRAALNSMGRPLSWANRFTGSRFGDVGAATPRYGIEEIDVRAVPLPVHLRTGAWRSVAASQHGFFVESFVDELANTAGRDPFEYRRDLLEDEPRHRAVLERAAEMAQWGTALPEGHARGIAIVESFGSIVAHVAEVSVDESGSIRVHRVHSAVDCGLVVNPNGAEAQIQGGVVFGLGAALMHEITVEGGAVAQRNFPQYDMIRLAQAPVVSVSFINSGAPIGGLGEPGVPPVAPAVANAVFALTGQRLRTLPLRLT